MDSFILVTYEEGMVMLNTLQHATEYLTKQYSDSMRRDEAQAHFDARAILLNRRMALVDEMELEYTYGRERGAGPEEKA